VKTPPKKRWKPGFEHRLWFWTLGAAAPGLFVAFLFIWRSDWTTASKVLFTGFLALIALGIAAGLRERVIRPLQTLSNLVAALREGDYSIQGRIPPVQDSLGELLGELRALGKMLRESRFDEREASGLLRSVMEEIEVAILVFDSDQCLKLTNRAGERLLGGTAEALVHRAASELGLADCMNGEAARTVELKVRDRLGKWGLRRTTIRQGGMPHTLIVLADLSQALRDEERQAWQRLVRVLGHELNNSLAPIRSIGNTLTTLIQQPEKPEDWEQDLARGLEIISSRAESLIRFMEGYSKLAKLPPPSKTAVSVSDWMRRVAAFENRVPVDVLGGPDCTISADRDQLDQLLINLLKNAAEASLETRGAVKLQWRRNGDWLSVTVLDEGLGVSNPTSLFVPFFTTKSHGTGIGLALSRQIAEAHGGTVSLRNRKESGCEAEVLLPIA
jgi:two-component system, NtrC family, nitrogen regulation sensor histidine kinase NtrY